MTTNLRKPGTARLLTTANVARRLSYSTRKVRGFAEDGLLPGIKLGGPRGHWRFDERDVDAFVERRRHDPDAIE